MFTVDDYVSIYNRVHGEDANMSSVAHITFKGATENMSSEIVLPLRSGRERNIHLGKSILKVKNNTSIGD